MKDYRIFTAGKIDVPYDSNTGWRKEFQTMICSRTRKPVAFIHPPMVHKSSDSWQESMNWTLNQLIDSDIVVLRLDSLTDPAVLITLGVVQAINRTAPKTIYVVGYGKPDAWNGWVENSVFHKSETMDDAADYIVANLLL